MDDSSNLGEEVNPINPSLSYALSSFDIRHNFVVSYNYRIPFESLFRASNRWTQGWELSGITHLSTGLPVTLVNYEDNSLLGAEPNGINNYGVDEPDLHARSSRAESQSHQWTAYFNTALFSENALGTPGNAPRRFFSGPGMDNFDKALLKNVGLTESKPSSFGSKPLMFLTTLNSSARKLLTGIFPVQPSVGWSAPIHPASCNWARNSFFRDKP